MHIVKTSKIEMTEGPVFGKILLFAVPLLLTNALQVPYNAADMIVVGRFSSAEGAVGAIGATGPLINLMLNMLFGIAVGANVVAANSIGAGDEERTRSVVHSSIQLAVLFGVVSMAAGLIFSRQLLVIMNSDPQLIDLSDKYLKIYFLGVPFASLMNYASAILRAKGDTNTPFIVMSLSGLLNVILNIVFVAGLGMNVDGVAIATVISTVVSSLAILIIMAKSSDWCRLEWKRLLRFDRPSVTRVIAVGFPAGIQGTLFSVSNVFIQSAVNGFGPSVITGNAIAVNVESLAYTTTNSIYQATITFTGQNVGAKKPERIGMIMRSCYFATFCVAVVTTSLLMLFRREVTMLYMAGDTPNAAAVFDTAMFRYNIVLTWFFVLAFMEVGSGLVRGMGKSLLSAVVTLIGSCLLRIVWIYTGFALSPTLGVLLMIIPISWGITALTHFVCALIIRRKLLLRKKSETEAAEKLVA
jgi:putative MATE family efflux protein